MFTGLIAYRGTVKSIAKQPDDGVQLHICCQGIENEQPEVKDSIAINGVCLTATAIAGDVIAFDVVPETLDRSTLGALQKKDVVNVEYSLKLGDRIGGHFVYGHIDATVKIISKTSEGQGVRLRIERPKKLAPMLVEKAFVAIDGVSVTIANTKKNSFELALIPETLQRTTLGNRNPGDAVNLEIDPLARYVYSATMSSRA